MKKVSIFCLILAFLMLFSCLSVSAAEENNPAVTSGCHSLDAAMTLSEEEKITETAKAVIVYERNSGTMLYAHNPDDKIYPTSMVKLMTVLVAIENGDLDEKVTVTRKVLNQVPIGILGAGLTAGEEITLRDLLFSTMVESATDSAVVAAAHVGGGIDGFLMMMNEKAQALGCTKTHYGNVHGLHDENTYTTARDIARLTDAALQNETFREMFCTARYTMSATNKRQEAWTITTTNNMMNERNSKYYDKRVTGGKTGATDQGGRCLTLTAEKDGMELLCVVMGAVPTVEANGSLSSYGSFEESKTLLDYAFTNYAFRQVFFDGQSLAQYPVANGANDVVTQAASSVSTVVPKQLEESALRWVYEENSGVLSAPVLKGQELGQVQVWYGTKCLAQTKMVAMNSAEVYQPPVIPEKPVFADSGSWLILIVVLVIVLVAVIVLLGLRAAGIIKHKQKKRKRIRSYDELGRTPTNL
ncbi:MAG: D-alanyl-D-alanine carboxypeptidase [Ruminococcaceae bacterium]|nr:D-alanyl-D-alanine carboxypeptidase [Oscillospiraceae bacterium]